MDNSVINQIKKELKTGDHSTFKRVYLDYQQDFKRFSERKGVLAEDVMELYNDTMMVLHDNLVSDRLNSLTSSLKTYVFGIGKNLMYKRFQEIGKHTTIEWMPDLTVQSEQQSPNTEFSERLELAFFHMGKTCKQILLLFYYNQYSIRAIQDVMEYKNENTVKAHKSRCMKKLREIWSINPSDHE